MSGFLRVVPDLHHRLTSQILGRQGEGTMVTPLPVDVQVVAPKALLTKTQPLDDPQTRGVLRSDVDLDPMQPQYQKRVVAGGRQRERHDPLSCHGFGNPVARARRPQGAPRDPEQAVSYTHLRA